MSKQSRASTAAKAEEKIRFKQMSESELLELRMVLLRECNVLSGERQRRIGSIHRINDELKSRKDAEGASRIVITDHAVVRYLERIEGMDIEAVRAKVRDMAARSQRRDAEFLDDSVTGFTVVRRDGSESVATIMRKKA